MPVNESTLLDEPGELLMRQVHPSQITEGRPAQSTFTPTDNDNGLLSADRESLISPKMAYERYLRNKNLAAAGGTWGVSVKEFLDLGLKSHADPLPENMAHALVDFTLVADRKQWRAKGKLVYARARDRGRLYPH
jgi:hypothetical protein